MKKTLKITAISLSILMLVLSMPLTAFAGGTDASEPELIFAVDNLLGENKIDNEYDFTADPYYHGHSDNYTGGSQLKMDTSNPDAVIRSKDSGAHNHAVLRQTNIPIDKTAKYTITFSAQISDWDKISQANGTSDHDASIGSTCFLFSGTPDAPGGLGTGHCNNFLINSNAKYGLSVGVSTKSYPVNSGHGGYGVVVCDKNHAPGASFTNGYTNYFAKMRDYIFAYDNGVYNVYISDDSGVFVQLGTWNIAMVDGAVNFAFGAWISNSNAGVQQGKYPDYYNDVMKNENGSDIVKMKDIKLYTGCLDMNFDVDFYDTNGEVFETNSFPRNKAIGEFPELEDVSEGKVIKWFYKGTNTVASATHRINAYTELEAREVDPDFNIVVGLQTTEVVDNKMNFRFLSAVDTLDATEAGFEVKAFYKDGETDAEKQWTPNTKKVYDKINVGTGDVTAEYLGGKYVIALSIGEFSVNVGQVDFYARSYITVDGEKVYSEWVRFSMEDGVFNHELEAAYPAPEN